MRHLLLLATLAILTGCGESRTGDRGPAPSYAKPPAVVFEAARLACLRFKRLDVCDPSRHHLEATETNWPGGDTHLTVDVIGVGSESTVYVAAIAGPSASPGWNHDARDFDNFLLWLDNEMRGR